MATSSKNVLVTGGAGFIGSHLCAALATEGYRVTCLDNFSTGSRSNLPESLGVEILEADVNDAAVWEQLRRRSFEAVFHYAATVGVRRTEEEPSRVLNDVAGLRHLAHFARAGHAGKIFFASSSEVYGNSLQIPMTEAAGKEAWSPYTAVKLYGEYLLQALWSEHTIPTVSMRFFNVYGPRQAGSDYGFVVSKFIEQALQDTAPTVYGDGSQTRDFVYIADNVRACIAAMDNSAAWGKVINVGTGTETTIADLARAVIAVVEPKTISAPAFLPARRHEIARRVAATENMETLLGLRCETPLVEGLLPTISWQRQRALVSALP